MPRAALRAGTAASRAHAPEGAKRPGSARCSNKLAMPFEELYFTLVLFGGRAGRESTQIAALLRPWVSYATI
jgi:hypothetical protein